MKLLLIFMLLAGSTFSYAGEVRWGIQGEDGNPWAAMMTYDGGYVDETGNIHYYEDQRALWPWLSIQLLFQPEGTIEIYTTHPEAYMEFANTYVQAEVGDTVDFNYIENKDAYFAYARYGHDSNSGIEPLPHTDYSIVVSPGETVFLAFRSETSTVDATYGWIEIGIDQNGHLDWIQSAWDVDGDPITISPRYEATPEPSGGAMLALGFAALALRRRRR